jgi:hypothetical protein
MSILNRLRLNSHLDDAAIAAIWTDSTLEGRRAAHPHLGVCTACRTRFGLFSEGLDELRADAAAHADELFPAERLAAQHAQIFRRIEASERPARVIAFPKFSAPLTSRSSHASRWIAAAAAAGLIVGVGVGQVMDLRHIGTVAPAHVQARLAAPARIASDRAAAPGVVTPTGADEAFLSDLDVSLSRPSVPELRAIDEFTPRAGEQPR